MQSTAARPTSQEWLIGWDGTAGGFRGTRDGLETGAYSSRGGVERAIERGAVRLIEQTASAASEGLVIHQQSSGPARPAGAYRGRALPEAEKLERLEVLRAARAERSAAHKVGKARRWRFTIASEDEVFTMDSKAARIRRCQKRVHAWAAALPRPSRVVRRAGRALRLGPRAVMLTLTYADADGWQPDQIREFMKAMRRELGEKLYGYAWVLEVQERGAPHYHVLLYVKSRTDVPEPDKAGLWLHGLTRRETARSLFYICTYTGKEKQKEGLPAGARMFAAVIYKDVLPPDELLPFRLSSAPGWLAEIIEDTARLIGPNVHWSRAPGGGWVIRETGELHPSPWALIAVEPWEGE